MSRPVPEEEKEGGQKKLRSKYFYWSFTEEKTIEVNPKQKDIRVPPKEENTEEILVS